MKYRALLVLVLGFVTACGGDSTPTDAGSASPRGYTACADRTCQPGQYCQNNVLCSDGCLSDQNCTDNQVCDTDNPDIRGVSRCVNVSNPDGGSGATETDAGAVASDAGSSAPDAGSIGAQHVQDCQQVVERGLECDALPADEENDERVFCENELSAEEAADFADCVAAPASCDDVVACYEGDTSCEDDPDCNDAGGAHQICVRGACRLGCRDDDHCDTRRGITHQICQSSSCIGGCRDNDDCDPGDVCTAARLCGPAV